MLRDFKFLRRNSGKSEEIENVPVNPKDLPSNQTGGDIHRDPLTTIQEPVRIPKPDYEVGSHSKIERTPSKTKGKGSDSTSTLRTPDKHGGGFSAKHRFGWAQKNEASSIAGDDRRADTSTYSAQVSRGVGTGNGGLPNVTPRATRTTWKSYYCARTGNFAALYKGNPISTGAPSVVNTVEVPHFDLKEDPSFWINHNVQVLIRIRPLNSMERSINGFNRCLKQESAQSITWIGQPETRFTFDQVACETVNQETLFRMAGLPMVENCLSGYNSCMFAYGQTGSGKTYTMLGEIEDLEVKPSPHRGMTPRIFEFLFARIQAEEESRRDEKLQYNCKCSFLEIYNEQITDLLDPSSTNLLLREDVKKGVYVENLSEFDVQTVSDILQLLTEGSSNRKDSTTNLRFARLNLVDLAGSERQKTSGAEGERLKEAANINKSLSTLGHVIMVLLDVANGKPRHIPYRDSRLTFLLQDSLGGNSKTMIISNVSPSICCAAETLNTLKFAQRAKLIQNNAVVNEDSTGDVIALQYQIRLLKEELSVLKRQNVSRSLSFGLASTRDTKQTLEDIWSENTSEMVQRPNELVGYESKSIIRMSNKQLKSFETTLAGALRREQMAENSIKQLEAEIEQLNRLVRQREEDTRSCKMMLRFREDKIQRMESFLGGAVPVDAYLQEDNKALSDEVQLLQAKVDRNPEVTRFALENIRLLDQLRRFQEFYEEGEREILLAEVSSLREQLLQFLEGNSTIHNHSNYSMQPQEVVQTKKGNDLVDLEFMNIHGELEECRRNLNSCLGENAKLSRETDYLRSLLNNLESSPNSTNTTKDPVRGPFLEAQAIQYEKEGQCEHRMVKPTEEILDLQLELDILKIILKEERTSRGVLEERTTCLNRDLQMAEEKLLLASKQCEETKGELKEAKSVIEAIETQQLLSINEMEEMKNNTNSYVELLRKHELEIMILKGSLASKELRDNLPANHLESANSPLQTRLRRMHDSLENAKRLNLSYQNDRAFQVSNEEEMDEVRRQVEAETAEVIVCMQEELSILQQQVHDGQLKDIEMEKNAVRLETELKEVQEKLFITIDDNRKLSKKLEEKDVELKSLSQELDLLGSEIEEVLADGCESLIDASYQLEHITCSFPQKRIWISEQLGRMVRLISEKELLIEELSRCLEDANNKRSDVECKLKSLRGAALVLTEAHQQECSESEKEILLLTSELGAKTSTISNLVERLKLAEDHIRKASSCATVAFVVVNRLSEANLGHLDALKHMDALLKESEESNCRKDAILKDQGAMIQQAERRLEELQGTCDTLRKRLSEEQEHSRAMEQRLEDIEENDILKAREKLATLQDGVTRIRSFMTSSVDHTLGKGNSIKACTSSDDNDEGQADSEADQASDINLHDIGYFTNERAETSFKLAKIEHDQKIKKAGKTCRNTCDRDVTITLLKKELESALESLKEVQDEMAKLQNEKQETPMSQKQSQESIKGFISQILSLQAAMNAFEEQSKLKMDGFSHRLSGVEESVREVDSSWCQRTELIELEVGDAKIFAAQKAAEASCILAKFEEAQDTMKEADIVINGLVISNEMMKLDLERLKAMEITLVKDRDILVKEVQSLKLINGLKQQELENLVEQLASDLIDTRNLVIELSNIVTEYGPCLRTVWSEIVVKDCALSVLHLCHMGILLETVTGLNAENGLLLHGLCESNSVIVDLKEHNLKARRELDMCRSLKGKLLADIRNSFDRINRKEVESDVMTVKLTTFEKKISELQLQEETMLQRSNDMGSQLAILMRELDSSNTDVVTSLLDQEKMLKHKEEVFESQAEIFMTDWWSNDIQVLILASELESMTLEKADMERDCINCHANIELLKKEIIISNVDLDLAEQILREKEVEVCLLRGEVEDAKMEGKELLSKLDQSNLKMTQMAGVNKALKLDIQLLKEAACSNDTLKGELAEVKEINERLLNKVQAVEAEYEKLVEDLIAKDVGFEFSFSQNKELLKVNWMLETSSCRLQIDLNMRDEELSRIQSFGDENASLRDELANIKTENSLVLQTLEKKISEFESVSRCLDVSDKENHRLQDDIISLHTRITSLQVDLERKNVSHEKFLSSFKTMSSVDVAKAEKILDSRVFNLVKEESIVNLENMFQDICDNLESTSKNLHLIGKDQKDENEEMFASLVALEDELDIKSGELAGAVANCQMLEAQLQEKVETIAALEMNLSKEHETLNSLSSENLEMKAHIEDALAAKSSSEDELRERCKIIESLEMELSEMSSILSQMNDSIETLRSEANEIGDERDQLQMQVLNLKEKLDKAEALAEENEAIATEAQQIAESQKAYVEDKEVEVKLLERSVQELECTVNVLENKVDIIKEEAERQRLQREELELELDAVKQQMQNVVNADADMKSYFDEKDKSLQEALNNIQFLRRDIAEKDAEIFQIKSHMSELNLHAEAQATEYKQKFKALEAMAEQVKSEGFTAHASNFSSNKSEKNGTKPRGSGSPFKCIGLGLAQQIKSEKVEELTAARMRIEELESAVVSRQKEIFSLNARLAAAESMTHDVIRDLLGVKLDMTTYVSLLDNQQVQKIAEKAQLHSLESVEKEQEVSKLKNQLNEFLEERKVWLEEIDRKQAEMVAAQIVLEELRQRDQLLRAENEILKKENINSKNKVLELEGEVKKLSGQQNLQQRIHHHAKIKEVNNMLKMQNEELTAKQRRTDVLLSRVKEEVAHLRATVGAKPCVGLDEEKHLIIKLKETQEEKEQLARKLLQLCTNVLKAAGITKPVSDVSPPVAEEALKQLKYTISSLEREMQDLKLKNRISNERLRLSELMPQSSPMNSRTEDSCHTLGRGSQAQFLSTFDR
ncbi:Kinesin [Quillaja saponaria]|uniref:Kinesin n=1 Tax=Quillaja saponaria TaxID=32244 RepID=A0AAD7LZX3_QUISA|nr:Kinesin [Quillaja saponaria]